MHLHCTHRESYSVQSQKGSLDHFDDFWIQKSHHFYNFWIQKYNLSIYQNGVEFCQKVIGNGFNLFCGHLYYSSGVYGTFPRCRSRERVPHLWNVFISIFSVFHLQAVKHSVHNNRTILKGRIYVAISL